MLSALLGVVAFVYLALILRKAGVRPYLVGALGFAFTPVVYINSASTIDYVPAVALILAATFYLMDRRFIVAGVCLGISVGIRITSGAMLFPFLIWIFLTLDRQTALRATTHLVSASVIATAVCFVPVLYQYGLGFFTFTDNLVFRSLHELYNIGVYWVWGSLAPLALIALLIVSPVYFNKNKARLMERSSLALILLSVAAIAGHVILFLRLPNQPGYLAPLIPFTIIFFALVLPPAFIRGFAVVLLLSSFIDIGKTGFSMDGPILVDHHVRLAKLAHSREIIKAASQFPKTDVVVVAWELPGIETELTAAGLENNQFIYAITNQQQCKNYLNAGRNIHFLPGVIPFNIKRYHVDLRKCTAQ